MYANLLVYLDLFRDNTALLQIAGSIAERFGAGVTGVAASRPIRVVYSDGTLNGDIVELDRAEVRAAMEQAHVQFQSVLKGHAHHLAWRSSLTTELPADYVTLQARCADLVISHTDYDKNLFDEVRCVTAADLIMRAGRPVLTVPASIDTLAAGHILVAWKDTREARRAVADALPFLKAARAVTVAELTDMPVSAATSGASDVAAWLAHHGVKADCVVEASRSNTGDHLLALARAKGADLIVAGAYGHHRLREWAFGGVTWSLLAQTGMCTLMSH